MNDEVKNEMVPSTTRNFSSDALGELLATYNYDLGALRPYIHNGKSYITVKSPNGKSTTVLTKKHAKHTRDEWVELDKGAIDGFRKKTPVTSFLLERSRFDMPTAMGKVGVEDEVPNAANSDLVDRTSLPLPITHADFKMPRFDPECTMAKFIGRRVGEMTEKTVLGKTPPYEYAEAKVLGLCGQTEPPRKPIAAALNELYDQKFYGPYVIVGSPEDVISDSFEVGGELVKVEKINSDWISDGEYVAFQLTPDVIQVVDGIRPTVVEWEDHYKLLCIVVPRVRNKAGIVHGRM